MKNQEPFTYGSFFTGIGGMDLGFDRAGMQCKYQVEIDQSCQDVLYNHWPKVEKFTDVKTIKKSDLPTTNLICGGFPCQDVSIAGRRKGLAGERSGLWFYFAEIIEQSRPDWLSLENVPGLLSSHGGQDFKIILDGLVKYGYSVCWRIFDAQYFGVAQRRRRLFIIGSLGNGRSAQVLFEREGMSGDSSTRRITREDLAGTFTVRTGKGGGGKGYLKNDGQAMTIGPQPQYLDITGTLDQKSCASDRGSQENETDFLAFDIHQNDDGRKDRPNGGLYVNKTDKSLTLQTGQGKSQTVICNDLAGTINGGSDRSHGGISAGQDDSNIVCWEMQHAAEVYRESGNLAPNLQARMGTGGNNVPLVGVRRLTPTECSRLQGFPDHWNIWESDARRYKQFGNAVVPNITEWIGKRIMALEEK
jgi:DNA (cytosine-5)-methyltransferase 1